MQTGWSGGPGSIIDRSLSWTGDMVDRIVDNNNPATTPPFTYTAQSQLFTYTPTRRLKSAQGYYGTLSWTYDANGNRASETRNGVTSAYAYPATSNRLTSVTPAGQTGRSFTYDASGDILTDSRTGALGMTYQYDVEGRLSKVYQTNAPSQGATYAYDATNRLASRTATSGSTTTTTLYVHDINDHIIAETNTAGQTLREYIWLNDLPIAIVDKVNTASPVVYYVHTDHLKRPVRLVLAQDWRWAWDVAYGPFGEVAGVWADPGVTQDMRFPGQWFQTESGLAYNWHRHYDATLGRYVQPDPIGYDGGRSLYGYVGHNPLAYVDPDGRNPVIAIVGICARFPQLCISTAVGVSTWFVKQSIPQVKPKAAAIECGDDDNPDCSKATRYQLNIILNAAQENSEHEYKTSYRALPNSRFDICACKDGSVVIKNAGGCGSPGPVIPTYERWK